MKTLYTSRIAGSRGSWPGRLGMGVWIWLLGGLLAAGLCGQANALEYDPGVLEFSALNQSMWSEGSGTSIEKSLFLGTEWTNTTATIGGIVGGVSETTVITNPAWWVWKGCKETINFLCGDEPAKWEADIVTDTRTGAQVNLTSSGRVGIEAGFMVDSGTVDATADFAVTARLPDDLTVAAGTFFSLNPSSTFESGTIDTQSPWIKGYVKGVLELAGSFSAQACLILAGCTSSGTVALPPIDYHPEIISIDPNRIALFGGKPPFGFESKLAKASIIVKGDLLSKQLKITTTKGDVLLDNIPPGAMPVDLANITFKFPNITTTGSNVGSKITSSGRDTVIDAKLDLDGVVAMATGFTPLVPITLIDKKIADQKVEIKATLDIIDVKVGPTIDIFQNFELTPTLMVDLKFDKPVNIAGVGTVTSYSGVWNSLPDMALLETTTITPTFWLDAALQNTTGVDFGFALDLAALKASITATFGGYELLKGFLGPAWSKTIPLGGRFGGLDLYNNSFDVTGFNRIDGNAFTLSVSESGPIPEPGTLLLMGVGLAVLGGIFRRRK